MGFFYFTITPAPKFSGLATVIYSKQFYQKLSLVQHMLVLSETWPDFWLALGIWVFPTTYHG